MTDKIRRYQQSLWEHQHFLLSEVNITKQHCIVICLSPFHGSSLLLGAEKHNESFVTSFYKTSAEQTFPCEDLCVQVKMLIGLLKNAEANAESKNLVLRLLVEKIIKYI